MRDIILTLFVLCGLVVTLRAPFVGLLLWVLFSIMNPHQETYSFARSIPWNLIIAIVTTAGLLASREPKWPLRGMTTGLVLALLAWSTFNTFFAFDPAFSWIYWNRAWKTIAMCILAGTLAKSMVRLHAVIWVAALSLCYYGIKGGIFTFVNGGHAIVYGPESSMIRDNNLLADALVMILPILNYLRMHSESRLLRIFIGVAIFLVLASILGSYSREAYIALAALGVAFWLRTRNKFIYPILVVIAMVPLLHFMPESFFQRATSIGRYNTDASFQTRLDSWWVAYRYAIDHIPFGAGFYGMNLKSLWDQYIPGEMHAAHSIYFQVLGEQGVVGLGLYLLVIASAFVNLQAVRRNTKGVPEFAWARDLATMMQLSLLSFCISGAAAPVAFFDLFLLWTMLSAGLRQMTRKEETSPAVEQPFARQLGPIRRPLQVPPT
jgi:putative inorganic carbon (hco3(-)) transporter